MQKLILTLLLSLSIGLSSCALFADSNGKKQENYYDDYEQFVKVVRTILDKYVDDVDIRSLFEDAYNGMLSGLDSYSVFFPPEDLEEVKIETEGEFEGLGIEVVIRDGRLMVISPIVDSPAMRAGVLAGDVIVKIDGVPAKNLTFREVVKSLRGKLGSEITLTVFHRDADDLVDITIKRAKILVQSVRGARMVDDKAKIGYTAITNFHDHTSRDFKQAITELNEQGMQSLILDLRFNPGGLLDIAIEVAEQLLESGIIVSTKGRGASQNIVYKAHKRGTLVKGPIVVLINNGSASASEIVAGAIKDNKRGILVGNRTFGKGSVQSLLPVNNGKAALKLTTARYYTPSGASIHDKGIYPDIHVELSTPDIKKLHENLAQINAMVAQNSYDADAFTSTASAANNVFTDRQLQSAINILKSIAIISK